MNMKIAKIISGLGVIAMSAVLLYGFTAGDFGTDGGEMCKKSLGRSFAGRFIHWIYSVLCLDHLSQENYSSFLIWVVLMMVLGFFTASLYVFITLNQSNGDWQKFWMGKRADEQG